MRCLQIRFGLSEAHPIADRIAAIDDKKPPIAHYCDGGLIFSSHQFFAFGEVVEEGGVKGF